MTQPISPPAEPVQVHVIHKRRRWPWVIAVILAFWIGTAVGAQMSEALKSEATEPVSAVEPDAATVTEEDSPEPGTIPGSGTFIVGVDVKPGTYRTQGGDDCYWARSKGTSGDLRDVIANDIPGGPAVVTIKSSDGGFKTSGCGDWVPVKK